ncbi:amidohydrolase family protein [Haladaptatus sp. DYF46]|uniref:amidohydrolase family protein n=1 Tax=Haladaptatus sp. DYF46 TaxID=2886041 RepID=UPI001E3E59ED|nr:amidohydrolase family protein [Haladaptatus sp. DYF46]
MVEKIDAYAHIVPEPYYEQLESHTGGDYLISEFINNIDLLTDVETRLTLMDKHGIDRQILVPASPAVETVADSFSAAELARSANDGVAEVVNDHPDRFDGIAMIPMNNPSEMVTELERAILDLGLSGVLLYTSVDNRSGDDAHIEAAGKPIDTPLFEILYETAEDLNAPIWLHPERPKSKPDYVGELESKYLIWQMFGWPFETTKTMARLVFSGVLERYPDLEFIVHHAGGMTPLFDGRIEHIYQLFEEFTEIEYGESLSKPYLDYFKMFNVDTATMGSTSALMATYEFYGPENMVFGTDMPFDIEGGEITTSVTDNAVLQMDIPKKEKEQIFSKNINRLLAN